RSVAAADVAPAGAQGRLRRRSRRLRDRRAALSARGRLRARRRLVRAAKGRGRSRAGPGSRAATGRRDDSGESRVAGVFASGDVAAALGAADRVVAVRFHQGRQTHVPLEPRGCLASWLPGDETLNFWHSTQIPHPMRSALAARLGISESAVRVITPDVGGGFGQKIPLYREELATAAASRLLGRPVRWIETRREN